MKIFFIILVFLGKFCNKTTISIGSILIVDKYKSQNSYTSGNANGFNTWRVFPQSSPGNTYTNSINVVAFNKDSAVFFNKWILFDTLHKYDFAVNSGGKFGWLDGRRMKFSSFDKFPLSAQQVTTALGFMPSAGSGGVNTFNGRSGIVSLTNTDVLSALTYTPLQTESDPFWIADKSNYYTKTSSDGRYLQSESDPLWSASPSSTITTAQTNSWTTAYGWGNHADEGYMTAFSTNTLSNKTANISMWTNDVGYISSYTETDPTFDNKFSDKTTTHLAEGTNLYYTQARFNASLLLNSTSNLPEGTNLYYTQTRFNTSFAGKTTTDLTEGFNQYFTLARARNAILQGSGITYTNGVISNAAPDQVVTLTAGNSDISITGTYPNFTLTPYVPTTYTVSRTINSATFQPSSTRRLVAGVYNIGISCTSSIGSSSSGRVLLQYSVDNGSTWLNASSFKNSNDITLAATLQLVNDQEAVIVVNALPVGVVFRLVPTTSGTVTITYLNGYETY